MDLETLESSVRAEISDATSFIDTNIGLQRMEATKYYRGELFGDEEEGRSQVVSRDVHDVIGQYMPSLMRMFFGPEKVVEFVPQNAEDVESAEQATDYINYIVQRDNPGFEVFYSAFKDALVRKAGFIKWWWDESEEVTTAEYTGLDDMALTKLMEDLEAAQKAEIVESKQGEDGLSITVKLTRVKDRACIACLPPEEFLINRRARDIDSATFVAHRCMKTVSDLVALGFDKDEVEGASQSADEMQFNLETQARNQYQTVWGQVGGEDPTMRLVLYIEGYIRADVDGDGIAELVKVCAIGPSNKLVHHEAVDTTPFAAFHADPEPHTFFGMCPADNVMDIQRSKSALLRATLDSISLAINPRTVVTAGANLDDVMNTEIGAIIRAKAPTDITQLVTPDVSGAGFQGLTYMDQVKEARTGMSRVSQGLAPETLQTMTATASSAQFTQSQQHIELIGRIFAETGMKRLFRGLLKLVVENQRKSRMVQLRNKWTEIDPRAWRVDMDVTANVALGGGTNQEKLGLLMQVKQTQEQILLSVPGNPIVGLPEYHNTLSQILQIGGFKNPDAFFKDPANAPPQEAKPEPPNPDLIKVQGEQQVAAQKLQIEQGRLQLDATRMQMDAQAQEHAQKLAEYRLQLDAQNAEADRAVDQALKLADLNAKYKTSVTVAQIKAEAEQFRGHVDLAIQASEAGHAERMAHADRENAKENAAEGGSEAGEG